MNMKVMGLVAVVLVSTIAGISVYARSNGSLTAPAPTPGGNLGVKGTCYDQTDHLNFQTCAQCDSTEQTEPDYSYMMNTYHHDFDCYEN